MSYCVKFVLYKERIGLTAVCSVQLFCH